MAKTIETALTWLAKTGTRRPTTTFDKFFAGPNGR